MVALHRWRLLSSFTQVPTSSQKCQRNSALQIQVPSLPSAQRLHMRDGLQMIFTCTCWHSSFLIRTSSSAPQLWHSAYAAHPGIQTTAMISVSQLLFAEGSRVLMPAGKVAGEGCTFPSGRTVMDCHQDAVCLATLGGFSSPAGRGDLILQVH